MTGTTPFRETDLYQPVKDFLEAQGFEVKGEVREADVVACRDGEDPVIVELKAGFSLTLLQQGVTRQRLTDAVYLCVPRRSGRAAAKALRANIGLCRRLGLGVLTVRLPDGLVQVHADPGPFQPRKSAPRKTALLREFARRSGDPAKGGAMRDGLVTAYRQDAARLAEHLARHGASKGSDVAGATGVTLATRMMADNHYGWFRRCTRGVYDLTPAGHAALGRTGSG